MINGEEVINSMEINNRTLHWMLLGIGLGYPTCCIKSFLGLSHITDPTIRKLEGTGFIPCVHCNETKTTGEMVDEINRARNPNLPKFSCNPEDHQ